MMSETLKRSITGLIYITILVLSIVCANGTYFTYLFFLYMLIASTEFSKMIKANKITCLAITFSLGFLLLLSPKLGSLLSLTAIPFLFLLAYKLFNLTKLNLATKPYKFIHLLGYILFPFLSVILLNENIHNRYIILSFFVIIWVNDTFAYICGRSFGKRKLFEKVSPKKTIEGFFGGLIFAIIAGVFCYYYIKEYSLLFWILISSTISFAGTIGDLVESKYKRQAEIKDSGWILPGHGGILDRLDSMLYIAPFLLLMNKIYIYVS